MLTGSTGSIGDGGVELVSLRIFSSLTHSLYGILSVIIYGRKVDTIEGVEENGCGLSLSSPSLAVRNLKVGVAESWLVYEQEHKDFRNALLKLKSSTFNN